MSHSTVGIELEWADVDRWTKIPEDLGKWSMEDYSVVNSDGHANCPTGETWRWGGEINTRPTTGPASQANLVRRLVELLEPKPVINFKCNLHVHVAPSVNLLEQENLQILKDVATYLRESEAFVYSIVEPLRNWTPMVEEYPDSDELIGATKRWRRNLTSHQHSLPPQRYVEMMSAQSTQEFKDAMAPPTKNGGRAWHVAPRPGMNMRSLWKHGTIEFRHFPGSRDPEEIHDAVDWCQKLTDAAVLRATMSRDIHVASASDIYHERDRVWRFPKFVRYDHKLAQGFEMTKWKK